MKQGSRLLQVTGILNVIGGGIGLVMAVLAVVGSLVLLGMPGGAILMVAAVLALLGSVIQLVAGILGVINWQKPEKAMPSIVFGIVIIVIIAISNILNFSSGAAINFFSLILNLALPVLYLIGAFQLKGMAGQAAAMPPPVAPVPPQAPAAPQDPQAPQGPIV